MWPFETLRSNYYISINFTQYDLKPGLILMVVFPFQVVVFQRDNDGSTYNYMKILWRHRSAVQYTVYLKGTFPNAKCINPIPGTDLKIKSISIKYANFLNDTFYLLGLGAYFICARCYQLLCIFFLFLHDWELQFFAWLNLTLKDLINDKGQFSP